MIWLLVIPLIVAAGYWLFMSPWSQVFGKFPYKKQTDKKIVALTFDDGPNEPHTSRLLEILSREKVKATFFIVGKNAQKYPQIVKKIDKNGHLIGNHSLSHQFGKYFAQPSFKNEISAAQKTLEDITGKKPVYFRPPWLFRQPLLLNTVHKLGLKPVSGVFCSSNEVRQPPAASIAEKAIAKTKHGTILIFHDGFDAKGGNRAQTVKAVEIVIKELKQKGYRFATIDEMLS